MDFYRILEVDTKDRNTKKDIIEIVPDFQVCRSKDLMIRGKKFYAIWDEEAGLWSTDEYDVQRLVDKDIMSYAEEVKTRVGHSNVRPKTLGNFSTGLWNKFIQYSSNLSDNAHQLDNQITFANTEVRKEDYVSKRLVYELSEGPIDAYDELIGTLYVPDERAKLEWAIGAIISGDARDIQKFIVLYGPAGAGKSTFLELVERLFDGYITAFEAKALTSSSNAFSTEVFRDNPLVAIQHDGDLSRIEDNTKLNSIVSHEDMIMNEKYKASYTSKINAFLFMGSNKAVKITDAKSGLIRRLIDVQPSGNRIPERRYHLLMSQIQFELGNIAQHCLNVYRSMGRDYYSSYRPIEMMLQTDVFFNYIEYYFDIFAEQDGITLSHAYTLYKQYCQEALIEYRLAQYRFREELKNYFREFHERYEIDGERHRSYYKGFITDHFDIQEPEAKPISLILDKTESLIDDILANEPAQYSKHDGTPTKYWSNRERMINGELKEPDPSQVCSTVLADLDTTKEHYVKPHENHIVIDFDLKDEDGNKDPQLNLEAASKWPSTYAEYSRGGAGIHLHYIYDGDSSQLSRIYDNDIEIKVFVGDSSLRRKLSYCNDIPVATISSGLPLKEKKMISQDTIQSEKSLRDLIARNLRKEIHPGTKPSMDFIKKILDDAYENGLKYDISDMKSSIIKFANNSTNQSLYCLKLVKDMKFQGKDVELESTSSNYDDEREVIFDCEVFPNLLLINWKYRGVDGSMVRMINPSPEEVEALTRMKLIGFNNRRYDNHILFGRIMGYSNAQLYELSKKIISNNRSALFGEAYNLSYADIYDFAATKMGLKKWQIELGLPHRENEHPWDEPVPEEKIPALSAYCDNDVLSTEAVLEHLDADFNARKMLAKLSGLPVNDTTAKHSAQIIFEGNREPQDSFIYTDLSERFPGYRFDMGKSEYRDEAKVGEGGYVYAEPGMHKNVGVLDVASMHPTSIVELNLFGPYTKNFKELMDARLAIKHEEYDKARKMFGGELAPMLKNEAQAEELSYALKIIINTVYGLTAATFPNPFKDNRNKDNIVAKRGALFMIDLKNFVQDHGYQVIHIKTDSIKIPNIDQKIVDLVTEFGKEYGYDFEFEAIFSDMCLINDAVFVNRFAPETTCQELVGYVPKDNQKHGMKWAATGAQFKHPYVFKKLFSGDPIENKDLCETKTVTTAMYLDYTPDSDTPMALMPEEVDDKYLHFVGRAGSFVPVTVGGGYLLREKDGKLHAVSGSSGHKWRETESVDGTDSWYDVDYSYFNKLVDSAIETIGNFGDFEMFVGDSFADDRLSA